MLSAEIKVIELAMLQKEGQVILSQRKVFKMLSLLSHHC